MAPEHVPPLAEPLHALVVSAAERSGVRDHAGAARWAAIPSRCSSPAVGFWNVQPM